MNREDITKDDDSYDDRAGTLFVQNHKVYNQ